MVELNEMCEYIDTFIADLMSGNIELIYSRTKDLWAYTVKKDILGLEKRKDKMEYPSLLGRALTEYEESKANPILHHQYAVRAFRYIVWAYTHQAVKRTGFLNKIKELEKENAQLKEEKDKYQKEIARLNQLNEALHQAFDSLGIKRLKGDKQEGE